MAAEISTTFTSNEQRHASLAGAWLLSLRSENSRRAYRSDLLQFFTALDASSLDALQVERKHVDAYKLTLPGSSSTIARKISALSSFYSYSMDEGLISSSPVTRVKRPVVDQDFSTTQGLTKDQAAALLDAAQRDSARSDALVSILLLTAARVSEALGARRSDLQWDAGHRVLVVTRKGGKRSKLALPPRAIHALEILLGSSAAQGTEIATDQEEEDTFLFTTATGKRWAQSEAFRTVQRLARAAGIEGKISPHSLRHTHATLALDAGVPLHELQDSLGHSDPRTTQRYNRARHRLEKSSSYAVANLLA